MTDQIIRRRYLNNLYDARINQVPISSKQRYTYKDRSLLTSANLNSQVYKQKHKSIHTWAINQAKEYNKARKNKTARLESSFKLLNSADEITSLRNKFNTPKQHCGNR
ncbi:hypothetical protein R3W88_010138 [Solanum pinnatisectum]|uniref:Uncharacterized protein n=1 Tax=Solanum pinnatisectum TaxID=50273 RepID=A0AAV9MD30_9SOLN|nr:hypothetical protein R3W88_010138 [Solanum pinnatisectum]